MKKTAARIIKNKEQSEKRKTEKQMTIDKKAKAQKERTKKKQNHLQLKNDNTKFQSVAKQLRKEISSKTEQINELKKIEKLLTEQKEQDVLAAKVSNKIIKRLQEDKKRLLEDKVSLESACQRRDFRITSILDFLQLHKHTQVCIEYASKTGHAHCITGCDQSHKTALAIIEKQKQEVLKEEKFRLSLAKPYEATARLLQHEKVALISAIQQIKDFTAGIQDLADNQPLELMVKAKTLQVNVEDILRETLRDVV